MSSSHATDAPLPTPPAAAMPPSFEHPTKSASSASEPPPARASFKAKPQAKQSYDEQTAHLGFLGKVSHMAHTGLETMFKLLAERVVDYPKTVVACVVLLTAILAQGVHRYEAETDGAKLFAPTDSRAVTEEEYIEAKFGTEALTSVAYFAADSGNLLTGDGMRLMDDFWVAVTTKVSAVRDGRTLTYDEVCERVRTGTGPALCKKSTSPLTLWDHQSAVISTLTDTQVVDSVNNETQWRVFNPTGGNVSYYLSSVGLETDSAGRTTTAKAARMVFSIAHEDDKRNLEQEDAFEFQRALIKWLADEFQPAAKARGYTVEVMTDAEEADAADDSVNNDFGVLSAGYILMVFYACFVLARARPKYSHLSIAVVSVVAVGMSTLSSYGFCWLIGLKFNPVVQVLVLVLLGIGIDDTFVIMDSWWDYAHITDMKKRMISAMSHAGPAVTITSLTDLVAFLAGSSTKIPAIQVFCYYAAMGIFLDFAYQVTFVVAIIYLDSTRQDAGRRDVLCCLKAGDNDGWIGKCCVPQDDDADRPPNDPASPTSTDYEAPKKKAFNEAERGQLHYVVGSLLPRYVIGTWVGKGVVCLITLAFLGGAIYGCTEVNMNYNDEWFIPDDHRFRQVMEMRDLYFGGRALHAQAVTKELDYTTIQSQVLIEDVARALEASRWVEEGSTGSWLRVFVSYVNATSPQFLDTKSRDGYTIVESAMFYPLLHQFRNTPVGLEHNYDFAWDVDKKKLIATRMYYIIVAGPLASGQKAVDCLEDLREDLDRFGGTFPYSYVFVFWEGFRIFVSEITRNVLIASAAVFVLVTILTANLWIGIIVIITLGCVDTCMMGYMPWMGVELNSVSLICVVMAIGLAVDYSVHIAGAFLTVDAEGDEHFSSREKRAGYAVWKMGAAVVNGGLSTFCAVLPLVLAQSYAFKVFFRMLALIIFFGLWFGVLVLPIFLSLLGPGPNPAAASLANQPWTSPLDAGFATAVPPSHDDDIEMV